MIAKPCLTCGALSPDTYCPTHRTIRAQAKNQQRQSGWARTRTRRRILGRDGHQCTAAPNGHRCPTTTRLHVDHIVPLANGGTNDDTNLTTLCDTHNQAKGAKPARQASAA